MKKFYLFLSILLYWMITPSPMISAEVIIGPIYGPHQPLGQFSLEHNILPCPTDGQSGIYFYQDSYAWECFSTLNTPKVGDNAANLWLIALLSGTLLLGTALFAKQRRDSY